VGGVGWGVWGGGVYRGVRCGVVWELWKPQGSTSRIRGYFDKTSLFTSEGRKIYLLEGAPSRKMLHILTRRGGDTAQLFKHSVSL